MATGLASLVFHQRLTVLKRDPKDSRYSDYLSYYTEKELTKVQKIYEKYFEKFGYAKENL